MHGGSGNAPGAMTQPRIGNLRAYLAGTGRHRRPDRRRGDRIPRGGRPRRVRRLPARRRRRRRQRLPGRRARRPGSRGRRGGARRHARRGGGEACGRHRARGDPPRRDPRRPRRTGGGPTGTGPTGGGDTPATPTDPGRQRRSERPRRGRRRDDRRPAPASTRRRARSPISSTTRVNDTLNNVGGALGQPEPRRRRQRHGAEPRQRPRRPRGPDGQPARRQLSRAPSSSSAGDSPWISASCWAERWCPPGSTISFRGSPARSYSSRECSWRDLLVALGVDQQQRLAGQQLDRVADVVLAKPGLEVRARLRARRGTRAHRARARAAGAPPPAGQIAITPAIASLVAAAWIAMNPPMLEPRAQHPRGVDAVAAGEQARHPADVAQRARAHLVVGVAVAALVVGERRPAGAGGEAGRSRRGSPCASRPRGGSPCPARAVPSRAATASTGAPRGSPSRSGGVALASAFCSRRCGS